MIKGIIFDLDGTTVDTVGDINLALNKTLGSSFTKEECNSFVGNGLKNCLLAALRKEGKTEEYISENADSLYNAFLEKYNEVPVLYSAPYDGVVELFKYLKSRGIKIGIFSNKEHKLFLRVIKTIFPDIEFDFLSGRGSEFPAKPAPDAVWAFEKLCGASGEDVIYVGDSEVDYKCAKDAGVRCLILTWGSRSREFLLESGISEHHLIDTMDPVYKFFT